MCVFCVPSIKFVSMDAIEQSEPAAMTMHQSLQLVVVGTGAGATSVFHGESSSSYLVLQDDKPILLADAVRGTCCMAEAEELPPVLARST